MTIGFNGTNCVDINCLAVNPVTETLHVSISLIPFVVVIVILSVVAGDGGDMIFKILKENFDCVVA